MKTLSVFKVSILISTSLCAEAIPESLGTLTPTQKHLYQMATTSEKQKTIKLKSDPKQSDSRFSREAMNKLSTQEQLKDFFWNVTLPANEKLLSKNPELANFKKVSTEQSTTKPKSVITFDQTTVSVVNTDTVSAALSMPTDKKPVILNLANKSVPGGGVRKGSRAQEEDLCRTTTIYVSLEAADNAKKYPLGTFEALYSSEVLAHEQVSAGSFAAITMAGYRKTGGSVDKADYPGPANFYKGMVKKIQVIIDTAIAQGHVDIVLGALGCGAFATNADGTTDPRIAPDVARAFATVLTEKHPITGFSRYRHFRNIQFAILEKPEDTRLGNTFRDALGLKGTTSVTWGSETPPLPQTSSQASSNNDQTEEVDVPELAVSSIDLNALLSTAANFKRGTNFFNKGRAKTVVPTSVAKPWTGAKAPWPIAVKSYTANSDGGFTMIAHVAHQDLLGAWYTTEVKITGSQKALTDDAQKWIQRNVR